MALRNIQVIDGADNCTYDIFAVEQEDFLKIFPEAGQDIEFADDFVARVGEQRAAEISDRMWRGRLDKKNVHGIHGTLFYDFVAKKLYYPTRKEAEMVTGF